MRSPLRFLTDELKTRRAASALLSTLKQHRPGGVDLPRDGDSARALAFLLKHNTAVTVVTLRGRATLMFKADVDLTFTPEVHRIMDRAGIIAHEGQDLTEE